MATCATCGHETADAASGCPSCRRTGWGVEPATLGGVAADTALALLPQLAFLFAVAAFVGFAIMPDGHHGNPVHWARAAVLVAGAAVRGGVGLGLGGEGFVEDDDPEVVLYAVPLLATITGLGAVAYVARRRERAEPSAGVRPLAARSLLTGAGYALALAILGAAARGKVPYSDSGTDGLVQTGLRTGSVLVGGLLLASLAAGAGRASAALRRDGRCGLRRALLGRVGGYGPAIEAAVLALAITALGGLLYAIGYVLVDNDEPVERARAVAGLVLLAPNAGLAVGGFASGATAGFDVSAGASDRYLFGGPLSHGIGFLAGGVEGKYWLLLLIPLVAAIVAGIRLAGRTEPGGSGWAGWYRPGLALAGCWVLAGLATQVGVSSGPVGSLLGYRGSGIVYARAGLGLPSLAIGGFAFGTLIWLVARFAGPGVAAGAPALFRRVAGPDVHDGWRPALGLPPAEGSAGGAAPGLPRAALPRPRIGLLLAVAGLVAAAGVGVAVLRSAVGSPERAAERYLEAVRRGDAEAALALTADAPPPPRNATSLLTDAALDRQVAAGRVTAVRTGDVMVLGSEARVRFELEAGSRRTEGELALRKRSSLFGLFGNWRVTSPGAVVEVVVPDGVDRVVVNGAPVPVSVGRALALVFPGTVAVGLPPDSNLTAAEEVQVVADYASLPTRFDLDAALKPEARQAVLAEVDRLVAECVAVEILVLGSHCPFAVVDEFSPADDVRWTVVTPGSRNATVEVRRGITVRGSVELALTYRAIDFGRPSRREARRFSAPFRADVTYVGGKPQVVLRGEPT